ncbi:MFS transporter [Terribacillus saccharophilus]|uniref:MFS transporter n=1 Tax=Terribacillus saccharophilus TaxID=361277 RepID=A0A268AE90_9BACI|nr:MFS transporter [Terribacillus saccharophilus]PAD22440.1 MFS transporter [Terribacillus saccharophilus]PAF18780.1 MFS transporter [Terribacillus saccharophilus]PAF23341.1 MFS transporter [Terribacillus saccharophilus]PAF37025.1 MFS transporter [Terribacillus saccharophilus]PAF40628.1 MFS transporter [Terribacillus saccharophilus]
MTDEQLAKRNLFIMWFANFFISASLSMIMPFLSLYISSFGTLSEREVQSWSGIIFGVTFVTAFICSPFWGKLGDRHGRKLILIISSFGMGVSILLLGFTENVWQLFMLRVFMGIFTGFIGISQAFISTQTPSHIAGRVLGTLQTGSITGMLFGPLIGGILADSIGFHGTFLLVSISVFTSAILVTFGTKEYPVKIQKGEKSHYTSKEVLAHILRDPILLVVLILSSLIQIANFSVQPILSLYVQELHGPENIAFYSGIAFSAAGLGNLLMTRTWGKLGDRIGYVKILIGLIFAAGIVYIPGALVGSVWELAVVRLLLGMAIGGIIPLRVAYIRQAAPLTMQGEVLGYNNSLRFLGNFIGPILGGMMAGYFGFSAVFYMTSALLIICGITLLTAHIRNARAKTRTSSI